MSWEDSRAAWSLHRWRGGGLGQLRVSGGGPEHLPVYGGDPEHLRVSGGDPEHLCVTGGDLEHLCVSGPKGRDPDGACMAFSVLGSGSADSPHTPQEVHKPPSQSCGGDTALATCLEEFQGHAERT